MAKSLGQIHTVNWTLQDIKAASDPSGTPSNIGLLDLGSRLTDQLQTMVRTTNIFKVVGIDMTLEDYDASVDGGGQISGRLEYYAPTRGRCLALKNGWEFQRDLLKASGIPYGKNSNYDFKPQLMGEQVPYTGIIGAEVGGANPLTSDVPNLAYSPDPSGNPISFCLAKGGTTNQNIFDTWNASLNPSGMNPADVFDSGFTTPDGTNNQDFVLFDDELITRPRLYADDSIQWIPFQMSWTPSSTDVSVSFNWRPDPALYLSILTGQFNLYIEELDLDGGADALTLRIAMHVAGWKSAISTRRPRNGSKSMKGRKTSKKSRKGRK